MTVQELIDKLNEIEDKAKDVYFEDNDQDCFSIEDFYVDEDGDVLLTNI